MGRDVPESGESSGEHPLPETNSTAKKILFRNRIKLHYPNKVALEEDSALCACFVFRCGLF